MGSCRDCTSVAALKTTTDGGPWGFEHEVNLMSKNGSIWGSRGAVLGSKVSFFGCRMGSENGSILDPIKLLLILDPGPEIAILQCKSENSGHGQDC